MMQVTADFVVPWQWKRQTGGSRLRKWFLHGRFMRFGGDYWRGFDARLRVLGLGVRIIIQYPVTP